jgi:cell division protein FtsW
MAVAVGLLPTTGLPLPFVSYGGSAFVMILVYVGILLSLSREVQRRNMVHA